jgi:hypothetical protein
MGTFEIEDLEAFEAVGAVDFFLIETGFFTDSSEMPDSTRAAKSAGFTFEAAPAIVGKWAEKVKRMIRTTRTGRTAGFFIKKEKFIMDSLI